MKYLKSFYNHIKENHSIGYVSSDGEWKEHNINIPLKDFFKRFYIDKEKIDEDDNYITYSYYDKNYDEDEDEYFWEKKLLLKVDKSNPNVTHYFEKTLIDRPLYKIREEGMTREQELTIRSWTGTKKNPKSGGGSYIGYDKGLAKFRSGHSKKLYHVLPNGDILELLNDDKINDDKINDEYISGIIDYLLDTKNFDLIDIVKNQAK